MEDNLLVLRANKMIDDMRSGGIAARVAKPLGANQALDHGSRGVNATVTGKQHVNDLHRV